MAKKANCYGCMAYDCYYWLSHKPNCLVGEETTFERYFYHGAEMFRALPVKKYCKIKNRKDYIERAERFLKTMTIGTPEYIARQAREKEKCQKTSV